VKVRRDSDAIVRSRDDGIDLPGAFASRACSGDKRRMLIHVPLVFSANAAL